MLVLSRKAGQRILIGEDVEIVVGKVTGSRVVLAVAAPRNVAVRRKELLDRTDECRPRHDGVPGGPVPMPFCR